MSNITNEILSTIDQIGMNKDLSYNDNKLKNACKEFESIFITYLLKSMEKTIENGSLLGNSNENKIMKAMHYEKLGVEIARGNGIGLGKMLFEKLKEEKT